MKNNIKFSIITPSFNQGDFIEQTIQSLLAQEYKNYEHIIIDGGSTDRTIDVLKKYSEKVKWISEKDKGQSDAINKGFRMASGDVLAWLNSDDYYYPNTLQVVANFFADHPVSGWVTGDYCVVDSKGKQIRSFIPWYKALLRKHPSKAMLSLANFIVQPSTFWRKEVEIGVGTINNNLHYTMDYEYWFRIFEHYSLSVIEEKLSAFRVHDSSKCGIMYEKVFQEEMKVLKLYSSNKLLNTLHRVHNQCIIKAYQFLSV
ncbi:MAG: glycosyltransferase family 2 protein [bacterium]